MQITLWAHPASPNTAVDDVVASLERVSSQTLRLRYTLRGRIDELVIPPRTLTTRADKLWETTCFEAFLSHPPLSGYLELNFSPSSQWAAYDFAAYRAGMVQASLPAPPDVDLRLSEERLDLTVTFSLDAAMDACRLRPCAVIEQRNGYKSYWAADHAAGAPDFHREDCFGFELPAARPA
jgi:hypothetical protein